MVIEASLSEPHLVELPDEIFCLLSVPYIVL